MENNKDHFERRCPKLGNPVSFQYCRSCGDDGLPCGITVDCWWEFFDIKTYLKKNLPADKLNSLLNPKPQPKITSLIDLIEQAKNRSKT